MHQLLHVCQFIIIVEGGNIANPCRGGNLASLIMEGKEKCRNDTNGLIRRHYEGNENLD